MSLNLTTEELQRLLDERQLPERLLKWITERKLISLVEVSPNTLKNWRCQRKVEYTKFCGIILYDSHDFLEQLELAVVKRKK